MTSKLAPVLTVSLASLLAAKAPAPEKPAPKFDAKPSAKPNWDLATKSLSTIRTKDDQPFPLPKGWTKDAAGCAADLAACLDEYRTRPMQAGRIIVAIMRLGFVAEAKTFAKNIKASLRVTTDGDTLIVECPISNEFNKIAGKVGWAFHTKGEPKKSHHKPSYVHRTTGEVFGNVRSVPAEHGGALREALAKGFGPGAMLLVDGEVESLPLG